MYIPGNSYQKWIGVIPTETECEDVSQHRPRKDGALLKIKSFQYHCLVGNTKLWVSFETFFSVHVATERRVKRVQGLLAQVRTPIDRWARNRSGNALLTS